MRHYSEDFYRHHAHRYAENAHQFLQSVYLESTNPRSWQQSQAGVYPSRLAMKTHR